MKQPPTGFDRREERDDFRRILIACENASNLLLVREVTPEQVRAAARLLRALISSNRLLMDELDRQDASSPEPGETTDFDTDLRLMLDAAEDEGSTP